MSKSIFQNIILYVILSCSAGSKALTRLFAIAQIDSIEGFIKLYKSIKKKVRLETTFNQARPAIKIGKSLDSIPLPPYNL